MSQLPNCPKCGSEYTYEDGNLYICPECANEWSQDAAEQSSDTLVVKDANGTILQDGDDTSSKPCVSVAMLHWLSSPSALTG